MDGLVLGRSVYKPTAKLCQLAGVKLLGQSDLGPSCSFITSCSVEIIEVLMETVLSDLALYPLSDWLLFSTKSSWIEYQSNLKTR